MQNLNQVYSLNAEVIERPIPLESKEDWYKNFSGRLENLTETERIYFKQMWPKYGTLYIEGPPGFWKTSIFDSISRKMNMNFIDLRLTQLDESDIGLYPDVITVSYNENGTEAKEIRVLDYIPPYWALEANLVPTLILFDELNRAQLHQRNAALKILLERKIGRNIKFNDTVLMAAAGNIGIEDGTEVESFDKALWNRLIFRKHNPTSHEWKTSFAKDNINQYIVNFVCNSGKGEIVFKNFEDNDNNRFTSARSWTMFDRYLKEWYGDNPSLDDIILEAKTNLNTYVNPATAIEFIKYLESLSKISLKDIREKYTQKKTLQILCSEIPMTNITAVLTDLKGYKDADYTAMSESEFRNIGIFLKDMWSRLDLQEHIFAVYQHILDNVYDSAGTLFAYNKEAYSEIEALIKNKLN